MRHLMATLGLVAVLLAGCDAAAEQTSDVAPSVTPTPQPTAPPEGDDAPTGADDAGQQDAAAGAVETISAGDAGEVDVRIEGAALELGDVRAAPGWRHSVNTIEQDEVELDFRHDDGRVLRLEVELEDGRLQVHTG